MGHRIDPETQTLSVFNTEAVVVVVDPGVSFQYSVLWLVSKPRKGASKDMKEYRFQLPKNAVAEHVNGLGSEIPPEIKTVATKDNWR